MINLNKILVPVDFSQLSIHAFKYAVKLAEKTAASIELLHVVETYKMNVDILDIEDIDDLIEKKARAKMAEVIKDQNLSSDLKISVTVRKGKIKVEIGKAAEELGIDLIVMGTTGVSGNTSISKTILGSNAHRVVQSSTCPVLTIPGGDFEPVYDDIVLPIDMTKQTTLKVDIGIRWAKKFNSTIHLVSVFNFFDEYKTDVEDLKRLLKEQADIVHAKGIEVKIKSQRYSDVADAIMDYAEDNKVDLIIIMSSQETKLDQYILGSRARDIITKARVPVLSLRPKSE